MQHILITGITGFIGKAVLEKIIDNKNYVIHAIVRPGTNPSRYQNFGKSIQIEEIDLSDSMGLAAYLAKHEFDYIIHIGAIRGGRRFSKLHYFQSNVVSVEVMADYCTRHGARLLFCSSVGVFGAIPEEQPANNHSIRQADNYYHYTKIEAEKRINRALLRGLKAAILRPSITYGEGDYGFPYQLVRMVSHKRFPLINRRTWIHLCHINTISSAFVWLLQNDFENGLALNVADREPVQLRDLVNFIYRQLHNKNYPVFMQFDRKFFAMFEAVFRLLKNELWISRVELISKSWIYEVKGVYELMQLRPVFTIPGMEIVIKGFRKS